MAKLASCKCDGLLMCKDCSAVYARAADDTDFRMVSISLLDTSSWAHLLVDLDEKGFVERLIQRASAEFHVPASLMRIHCFGIFETFVRGEDVTGRMQASARELGVDVDGKDGSHCFLCDATDYQA